jgi:ribosomal protein L21
MSTTTRRVGSPAAAGSMATATTTAASGKHTKVEGRKHRKRKSGFKKYSCAVHNNDLLNDD